MKYDRANSFKTDYGGLSPEHKDLFRNAVRVFNEAADQHSGPGIPRFPGRLRVKPMKDAPGIYEMTWSFAGPDGRATFEFIQIDGEMAVRWRRVGDHGVFKDP